MTRAIKRMYEEAIMHNVSLKEAAFMIAIESLRP